MRDDLEPGELVDKLRQGRFVSPRNRAVRMM
jgi:hypothetical protein